MSFVKCKNLILGYEAKPITSPINFHIDAGDYLCVVGENGSGKTTLMKTLLNLQEPLKGQIEMGDGLKKNEIGYLPQQTFAQQDFPASVNEIVMSGFQGKSTLFSFYGKKQKAEADRIMKKLGIGSLKNRCYRELSGGQQKRVLLARALVAADKLLLMDEPVASLDPKAAMEMYKIIEDLNREDKIAIMMISHDPEAALKYASHILYIGKTNLYASKEDFVESEIGKTFLHYERGLGA